jgi:tRNA(fMet)-specific endonuclease VapC
MNRRYLLDTNHLGRAINPVSLLRDRIYRERKAGIRFGTCVPALCELDAGIRTSRHVKSYRRQLNYLLKIVRVWPIDREIAVYYGEILTELKRKGRVLSQVDIMLAALAKQMNLTLLITDRDFEALPEVQTENWLI